MISTANLTIQFAAKPLFEDVSVKFEEGAHYGLIGANGSGKSTFVKILSGALEASNGQVIIGNNQRVASLSQNQFAFEEFTVIDTVIMGHQELWNIKQERDAIYALADMSEEQGMRVAELEMHYAELDGYSAESRAGELLLGIDIPTSAHQGKMSELAPGLKLRVLLTQVIFSNPDIMLLDEPTNNLDINTIRWLEQTLRSSECTMIIVSHDRHFLNSVCTHTADLDYGRIQLFPGNYDTYMLAASQSRNKQEADNARKKAKISELQTFVRRFSANASKSKQATSRLKQIDKIQLAELKPSSRKYPYIKISPEKKIQRVAAEVSNLTNGYDADQPLFKEVNLFLAAGQKIAIIGRNGIGKTTFLKTLLNQMPIQSGNIKWSENAKIGYLAQDHGDEFTEDITVYDWMTQWGKKEDDEQVIRGILGRMLFSGDAISKKVQVLSGGEKVRMMLGKLCLLRPNVLVLDEPTNHLDMESIEAVNGCLEEFSGTVLLVSHDREMVASVATQIIEIKSNAIVEHYQGNYNDYLAAQGINE
jgi:ATPase subunit of ABC transporter with duplicated ATPase domains